MQLRLRVAQGEVRSLARKEGELVGRSVERLDGRSKVTGQTRFSADLEAPGMLHARTLRSPFAHARLVHLDTRDAEMLDGVAAVLTAHDIPGADRFGVVTPDQPVLVPPDGVVHMLGDPVALVAAESASIAQQALGLINVEYQPLPAVTTPESALLPDAPLLFADRPGNVCAEFSIEAGDVERGFSQSQIVIDNLYSTPRQEHAYLEPEAGLATIELDGTIVVYSGAQDTVFYLRGPIASVLAWPENKVRVVAVATGGAFGGKTDPSLQIHLALLALKTGRPVKMVWSREESLLVSTKRHPMKIRHRLGVSNQGRILAIEAHLVADAGAYTSHSPWVLPVACRQLAGAYSVENVKIHAQAVLTNNPISGACRGYGEPQAVLAVECQINLAARSLGLDPSEFRLRNALREGDTPPLYLLPLDSRVSLPDTTAKALERAGPYPEPSSETKLTGRGMACAMPGFDVAGTSWGSMAGSGARLELFPDGSLVIQSGVCEIGTGITTALAQVAGECLGLDLEVIEVVHGDSATTPKSGPAVASRSAFCSGNAVRLAAEELAARLEAKAAEMMGAETDELILSQGKISVCRRPEKFLLIAEVANRCHQTGVNLVSEKWFHINHPDNGHSFTTVVADVEVDRETGLVEVLNLIVAHDAGRALNPVAVKGQLIGGALMGVGYALTEDAVTEDGVLLTSTLADYLIPTSLDIEVAIHSIIVEEPYPIGPFGARGVGEATTCAVPPAIMNAIYDATGVMVTELPANPEVILKAMREK
jgi:CO/xanthine dehydrogenase Mo-binding subunit